MTGKANLPDGLVRERTRLLAHHNTCSVLPLSALLAMLTAPQQRAIVITCT